jgi:hypothetical protein
MRFSSRRNAVARFGLVFSCLAAALMAQTSTGAITGTVTDSQGAVVGSVKVTATNLATNVPQVSTSSSAGVYSVPALQPGSYRLTAELAGFKKLIREPIVVAAQQTVTVDLELAVGETSSTVTVTAEVPLVQQSTGTLQYGINSKAIDELPFANANALDVLSTVPGVIGDPGNELGGVSTASISPGSGVSITGGRMGSTQYQADGVSNNSIFLGRITVSFSSDAVQEVSVLVNNYSAEYGRVAGGIVNMVTKSGSNKLHGTLFSASRNDILNAAPYANATNKKGMLRYWRGGADIGGPVYLPKLYNGKNRTFFFFTYEPMRHYTQSASYTRVPTALERQGDFSQSYYPNTLCATCKPVPVTIFRQYQLNAAGNALTNTPITLAANQAYPQFPNNIIPKELISPLGSQLMNLIPMPNYPMNQLGQNYFYWRTIRNTDNRYTVKLDELVANNNRLSFRISEVPIDSFRLNGPVLTSQAPSDTNTNTNISLTDTHTLRGNMVNDLRLGYNRGNTYRGENDVQMSQNYFQKYGFPSFLNEGFPTVALNDSFTSFGTSFGPHEIDNFFSLTDIFNWTKGKHNIKTGFEFQAPQENLTDDSSLAGAYSFYNSSTSIGNAATATYPGLGIANAETGFAPASLLLGIVNGANVAPSAIPYQYRWKYYAGFLQDDIKLTSRLTLNIGVRYQIEVPRSDKHHNQGYWVNTPAVNSQGIQVAGYVQMQGLGGTSPTLWPTRYNNIEPRFGFAYRMPAWAKWLTTVRGGYAITHTPTNGLFSAAVPDLSPKSQALGANGAANGGRVMLDNYPLVLPKVPYTISADGKLVDWQNVNAVNYLNQNVSIPYMQQWNLGLGFEIGRNYALQATYVGSKGTNLFGPSQLFNTIDIAEYVQEYTSGLNMGQLFPNPQGLKDSNGNVIQVTRANLLRPNPTMGTIANPTAQGYNSSYNALQVQLVKRFAHGVQFNANYTFSKSLDNSSCEGQFCGTAVSTIGTGSPQLQNGNRSLEKAISIYNVPNVFKFSYNWDLPFGRGTEFFGSARGILNQVIGNWKFSGMGTVQNGLPIQIKEGATAGFPEDVANLRPNFVPGVPLVNSGWRQNLNNPSNPYDTYLNPQAFAPVPLLTVGDVPRVLNIYCPHAVKYDMSIMKEFPIREQVKVVFRAELYGALNHPFVTGNANNSQLYQNLDYSHYTVPPVVASNIVAAFTNIGSNVGGQRVIQLGAKLYF